MPDVNLLAVLVAGIAAFALSGVYYGILGERLAAVSEAAAEDAGMPPWKVAFELARALLVALVVAALASQGEIDEWAGGLLLGAGLWIGFPFVLWTGAMLHERTPLALAAIHAGDWLVKLVALAVLLSVWH